MSGYGSSEKCVVHPVSVERAEQETIGPGSLVDLPESWR
jgi:hypothetical protein